MLKMWFLGFVTGAVLAVEVSTRMLAPTPANVPVYTPVECCAMLNVPLNEQVEMEYQYGRLYRGEYDHMPAIPTDAWRSVLESAPCR